MIRHICMFRVAPEALDETVRRAQSLHAVSALHRFEAVVGADGCPADNFNFAVICDVDDAAALAAYQADPVHVAFAQYLATVRTDRACIDYQL